MSERTGREVGSIHEPFITASHHVPETTTRSTPGCVSSTSGTAHESAATIPTACVVPGSASERRVISVGMGKIEVASAGEKFTAILGSCIGVVLYHPGRRVASLSHIVLATSRGLTSSAPGKFADTAIPAMIAMMERQGGCRTQLIAKFAGGATMFGTSQGVRIGSQNAAAVRAILHESGIPIVGEHVGGEHGRRVTFDLETGILTVEVHGESPTNL